ncbi:MAG: hypothetical protein K1060chlam1_00117 [Candidatus Anoxychlamydiales bacterium]|nr:hypothetical protein [Candidatus Anoxychlamydiales bacterium]
MSISIDEYIKNFNSANSRFSPTKWIHDHPTIVKVMQVVGLTLGAGAVIALSLFAPILPAQIAVGIKLAGGLSVLGSVISWLFLKYVTLAKDDMTIHAYQEKSCEGGRLYYRGDIPVLEFTGNNPEKWGHAHGFLLGAEICKLKKNLDLAVHSILRLPRSKNLPKVLETVRQKIPLEYQQEMRGLAEGYNEWAKQAGVSLRITEDDVLLMHLIPDSKHFHPKALEKKWSEYLIGKKPAGSIACTSILDRDDQGNVIFGRNMDWCPFGEAGGKSLVMVWKTKGVAVLGIPGMIGAVTGWNKNKVAVAMNVCPGITTETRGMPAILFNRHVLESATSVFAVRKLVKKERPLGPYHLTIADPKEGSCISFYQKDGNNHQRDLADDKKTIEVLNWEYPECEGGFFNSQYRHELLTPYFNGASNIPNRHPKLMENALQFAPYVNSWITMHSLVFRPGEDKVKISWDNGYAASGRWAETKMTDFF